MPTNQKQDSSQTMHNEISQQHHAISIWYKFISLNVAAVASGIPADIFAFPFCRIKTVMMTQGADKSTQQLSSTGKAFRYIYRTQGLSGFFRGLSPVLTSAIPGNTLFFLGMEMTQNMLGHNTFGTAISGFTGQVAASIVWIPSEIFKELRQMTVIKAELRNKNVMNLMNHVYKTEGIRGFYKGFFAQLLTFGPFNSLGVSLSKSLHDHTPSAYTGTLTSVVINGLSFGVAAFVTTPSDVIKTRIQVATADPKHFPDRSILSCAKNIVEKEGVSSLFSGSINRTLWLGTRQAIAFTLFSRIHKQCSKVLSSRSEQGNDLPYKKK